MISRLIPVVAVFTSNLRLKFAEILTTENPIYFCEYPQVKWLNPILKKLLKTLKF